MTKQPPNLDYDLTKPAECYEMMKKIWKMMKPGPKPKDVLNIDNETIEDIYQMAYHFYTTDKPKEALEFFKRLTTLDFTSYKFTFGQAACHQRLKQYEEAIGWYIAASVCDQSNPMPTYFATQCYIEIHQWDAANFFADKTIEIAGDNPEYKTIKDHALALKHGLGSKKAA